MALDKYLFMLKDLGYYIISLFFLPMLYRLKSTIKMRGLLSTQVDLRAFTLRLHPSQLYLLSPQRRSATTYWSKQSLKVTLPRLRGIVSDKLHSWL
jgi:hypothetical protein